MEACYGGTDVMERSCAMAQGKEISMLPRPSPPPKKLSYRALGVYSPAVTAVRRTVVSEPQRPLNVKLSHFTRTEAVAVRIMNILHYTN
jgi:hypothetical protein